MMGTGGYAVPTFRRLYETDHEVVALFTQPLRPSRGRKKQVLPMREVAEAQGTPIFDPDDVDTPESQAEIRRLAPDLLIVCDYGQILAPETLGLAPLGGINLHASILPKYRGAAPINWAIYRGDTTTGNTVIHMTPTIDAGPAIAQQSVEIGADEDAEQLEMRLAELGASLVIESMEKLAAGDAQSIEQDQSEVTRARRLRKTDGVVDWSRSAKAIRDQVRALVPWPKTFTHWLREEGEPIRLILDAVEVMPEPGAAPAGSVVSTEDGRIIVSCGEGGLAITRLQPAGKRSMTAEEFLRGHTVKPGDRFGDA